MHFDVHWVEAYDRWCEVVREICGLIDFVLDSEGTNVVRDFSLRPVNSKVTLAENVSIKLEQLLC